jgi:hypothetical protein
MPVKDLQYYLAVVYSVILHNSHKQARIRTVGLLNTANESSRPDHTADSVCPDFANSSAAPASKSDGTRCMFVPRMVLVYMLGSELWQSRPRPVHACRARLSEAAACA